MRLRIGLRQSRANGHAAERANRCDGEKGKAIIRCGACGRLFGLSGPGGMGGVKNSEAIYTLGEKRGGACE